MDLITQQLDCFPPQLREGLKAEAMKRGVDDLRKMKAFMDELPYSATPVPGGVEMRTLLNSLEGLGPSRTSAILQITNDPRSLGTFASWHVAWLDAYELLLNNPQKLLTYEPLGKRLDRQRWSEKHTPIFTRPVVRTLREWALSWNEE
jgi:hypothetical protein